MPLNPQALLQHLLDEFQFLKSLCSTSKVALLADETGKRALAQSVQVIAAAVKHLPAEWKAQHPHIDWDNLATLPERIIHGDLGVDYELAWDLATERLPELADELSMLVERE
jgi:uncharacterized protein with HEPN domain